MKFKKNLSGLITGLGGGLAGGYWYNPLDFEVFNFRIYGLVLLGGIICGLAGWAAGALIDKLTEIVGQKGFSFILQLMIGAIVGIQLGFWLASQVR